MFGFYKNKEHEFRIRRLEENDKTVFNKLDRIEISLKTQEKVGEKLDWTLEEMRRDREEEHRTKEKNAKNIREIKMWVLGLIGTILSTIVIAVLRMLMGI
ncbi:DUF2951 family protein [Staphylococcus ratti]|uniref:DUF2951 domain-containing protein n=1 Tax=Staphylococcus ratti TaxID=2892440 RepID=A0ABY3PBI5_9STAP|nr:DUF2951 family protein [Staphylococcus ratti]UEX89680.1 DUF2951 domain-containing protein [Staphylococcus ratti]